MELKAYFPEVKRSYFPIFDSDWISIQDGEEYLHFPISSLTKRELILLEVLAHKNSPAEKHRSAWHAYLVDGKGDVPEELSAYQFIYFNHQEQLSQEFNDVLSSIIGTVIGTVIDHIAISQTRTAFLIDNQTKTDNFATLIDILPTLENDFGQAFRVFIGNEWPKDSLAPISAYFKEENNLFSSYLADKRSHQVVSFPELMLWSLIAVIPLKTVEAHFNHCLIQNKDMSDMVVAMWHSQGNLVQSAQKLYIHRNSLQYKLDKLKVQSGLNLKNLDDLAFAYLFIEKK